MIDKYNPYPDIHQNHQEIYTLPVQDDEFGWPGGQQSGLSPAYHENAAFSNYNDHTRKQAFHADSLISTNVLRKFMEIS